jgi:hypothetical protein
VWHTLGVSVCYSIHWSTACTFPIRRAFVIDLLLFSPLIRSWFQPQDDATALDLPTLRAWNLILRAFFAEYLGLRPELLRRSEPSSPTYPSPPVRKSDYELVRHLFVFLLYDFLSVMFSDVGPCSRLVPETKTTFRAIHTDDL